MSKKKKQKHTEEFNNEKILFGSYMGVIRQIEQFDESRIQFQDLDEKLREMRPEADLDAYLDIVRELERKQEVYNVVNGMDSESNPFENLTLEQQVQVAAVLHYGLGQCYYSNAYMCQYPTDAEWNNLLMDLIACHLLVPIPDEIRVRGARAIGVEVLTWGLSGFCLNVSFEPDTVKELEAGTYFINHVCHEKLIRFGKRLMVRNLYDAMHEHLYAHEEEMELCVTYDSYKKVLALLDSISYCQAMTLCMNVVSTYLEQMHEEKMSKVLADMIMFAQIPRFYELHQIAREELTDWNVERIPFELQFYVEQILRLDYLEPEKALKMILSEDHLYEYGICKSVTEEVEDV